MTDDKRRLIRLQGHLLPQARRRQKAVNRVLAAGRWPRAVEGGFAHLEN
ncbi:hypothetical protein [Actinacidiphila alni]|nr:hypothetical protein [Actinacidiphila alni]